VDPRLLARSGESDDILAPTTLEDGTIDDVDVDFLSATYQGDGADGRIDLGPREQSRQYPKLEDEDATRLGDMRDLVARERERDRVGGSGAGATTRKKPETREPPPRSSAGARPPGPVGHDDATRAIDVGGNRSLSDVDWDLD
jgi:hypothetical protein